MSIRLGSPVSGWTFLYPSTPAFGWPLLYLCVVGPCFLERASCFVCVEPGLWQRLVQLANCSDEAFHWLATFTWFWVLFLLLKIDTKSCQKMLNIWNSMLVDRHFLKMKSNYWRLRHTIFIHNLRTDCSWSEQVTDQDGPIMPPLQAARQVRCFWKHDFQRTSLLVRATQSSRPWRRVNILLTAILERHLICRKPKVDRPL